MKKVLLNFYLFLTKFPNKLKRKFQVKFIEFFYIFYNNFYKRKIKVKSLKIIVGSNSLNDMTLMSNRFDFYFKNIDFEIVKKKSLFDVFSNKIKLYYNFDELPFYFNEHFNFFSVDPIKNPNDAWVYHNCLNLINPVLEKSHLFIKFQNIIDNKNKTKSYLFGTGNSLNNIREFNFQDGYIIVCNTIVKNKDTWNYLKPDIIVAADALYHFSDSTFAKKFRNDLLMRFKENNEFLFVYPIIFHNFIMNTFKEFENRLIPIGIGNHTNFKHLATSNFKFPNLGNVINYLVPIGMTFSKEIYLIGFDGRAPEDSDFWKNSDLHFYQQDVDELKKLHPAFFDFHIPVGNENKYHTNYHGDLLEENFVKAELKGWKFLSLNKSNTLPIQKRYVREN